MQQVSWRQGVPGMHRGRTDRSDNCRMVESSELPESPFRFDGGRVRATIDLRCYRLTAVQKAAYRLADRCTVVLGELQAERLPVTFTFPPGITEASACEAARLFFQELLDQEL